MDRRRLHMSSSPHMWLTNHAKHILAAGVYRPQLNLKMTSPKQRESTCVQGYIHFACGHDENSEFVQCKFHEEQGQDKKCPTKQRDRELTKTSGHRCRECLTSDQSKTVVCVLTAHSDYTVWLKCQLVGTDIQRSKRNSGAGSCFRCINEIVFL